MVLSQVRNSSFCCKLITMQEIKLDNFSLNQAWEFLNWPKCGINYSLLFLTCRNLADVTKDSKLDETEFCIAMHIITYRLKGIPIPDVLPPSLLSNMPPITADEKKRYSEVFKKADPNNEKFINGEQARKLFGKSGLDTTILAKIWYAISILCGLILQDII